MCLKDALFSQMYATAFQHCRVFAVQCTDYSETADDCQQIQSCSLSLSPSPPFLSNTQTHELSCAGQH